MIRQCCVNWLLFCPQVAKKSPNSVWMLQRNILKQVSRCFECILLIVTVKIILAYKSTRVFYFVVFTLLTASSTHQINISPLVRLIVIRINSLRWLCPVKICQKYIWMLACHEILSPEEGNCFSDLKVTSSESTFVSILQDFCSGVRLKRAKKYKPHAWERRVRLHLSNLQSQHTVCDRLC